MKTAQARRFLVELAKETPFDAKYTPDAEVGEGEIEIGVVPPDLKQVWCYITQQRDELRKECEEAHRLHVDDPGAKKYLVEHAIAHKEGVAVKELYWHVLRCAEEFRDTNIVVAPSVGLRKRADGEWVAVGFGHSDVLAHIIAPDGLSGMIIM